MADDTNELVFIALGGLSEIGMNAALYGYGPPQKRKWLMVDLGVAFAGPDLPGVDLIMPDLTFIEKVKKDLVGLIITHAHEDHIGAVIDLWPRLKCPIYATRFAAGMIESKRGMEDRAAKIPVKIAQYNKPIELGPFSVEYINVAHSIPESSALAIRTPAGVVVHTGDWKIDATPMVGMPTDEARLRALGDEGVLALVCDSTNILRDGVSPSESDVAHNLKDLIAGASGRVAVTAFASNVARVRAVALAAAECGRQVIIAGRAMARVIDVARDCGYLDGVPDFLSADVYDRLPRNKVVALVTGSQGEPRAAMARIAQDEHPDITLAPGDRVIFSSRAIPGNEKAVGTIINGLVKQGIEVITDRTNLVHVSGHPRRAEVAMMYDWVRPQIAIPAHGEALHLAEHAAFARARGVPHVIKASDGDLVHIGPGQPGIANQVAYGRVYKDGNVIVPANDEGIAQRRKLSFSGVVSIAMAVNGKGDLAGDPDVTFSGLPGKSKDGAAMDEIVDAAVFSTFESLAKSKRRDADAVSTAVEKAVRNTVNNAWGKKPLVHVMVVEV